MPLPIAAEIDGRLMVHGGFVVLTLMSDQSPLTDHRDFDNLRYVPPPNRPSGDRLVNQMRQATGV
jgi:hypothetical protein